MIPFTPSPHNCLCIDVWREVESMTYYQRQSPQQQQVNGVLERTNREISDMRKRIEAIDKKSDIIRGEIKKVALTNKRKALEMTSDIALLQDERNLLQNSIRNLTSHLNQANKVKMTISTQQCVSELNSMTKAMLTEVGIDEMSDILDDSRETKDQIDMIQYFTGQTEIDVDKERSANERLLDEIMNEDTSNVYIYPSSVVVQSTTTPTTTTQRNNGKKVFEDILSF